MPVQGPSSPTNSDATPPPEQKKDTSLWQKLRSKFSPPPAAERTIPIAADMIAAPSPHSRDTSSLLNALNASIENPYPATWETITTTCKDLPSYSTTLAAASALLPKQLGQFKGSHVYPQPLQATLFLESVKSLLSDKDSCLHGAQQADAIEKCRKLLQWVQANDPTKAKEAAALLKKLPPK